MLNSGPHLLSRLLLRFYYNSTNLNCIEALSFYDSRKCNGDVLRLIGYFYFHRMQSQMLHVKTGVQVKLLKKKVFVLTLFFSGTGVCRI